MREVSRKQDKLVSEGGSADGEKQVGWIERDRMQGEDEAQKGVVTYFKVMHLPRDRSGHVGLYSCLCWLYPTCLLYPFPPYLPILHAVQGYVDVDLIPGHCPG